MKTPAWPGPCSLTCGHEEGDAEFSAEHPCSQVLQGAPVEGQGPTHQHVQHHTETLHPKKKPLSAQPAGFTSISGQLRLLALPPRGKI